MEGGLYEVVPSSIQNEAVAFLNEQLFKTPIWLLDRSIGKTIHEKWIV